VEKEKIGVTGFSVTFSLQDVFVRIDYPHQLPPCSGGEWISHWFSLFGKEGIGEIVATESNFVPFCRSERITPEFDYLM